MNFADWPAMDDDFEVVLRPLRRKNAVAGLSAGGREEEALEECPEWEQQQHGRGALDTVRASAAGGGAFASRVFALKRELEAERAALSDQLAELEDERRLIVPVLAERRRIVARLKAAYIAYEEAASEFCGRLKYSGAGRCCHDPRLVPLLNAVLQSLSEWRAHETRHRLPVDLRAQAEKCVSFEALMPLLEPALQSTVLGREASQSVDACLQLFRDSVRFCDTATLERVIIQWKSANGYAE